MNYQFFKQNSEGRDFICGDVHGYFNILEMQLKKQAFNPAIDRVFSVGDLIDRGRGSADVLEWLEKPWFHAIQGNHERMLIKVVETKSKELRQQWNNWGGIWARSLDYTALQVFYDKIINMPAAIEVEIAHGQSVGLVHAELPDQCDWLEVKTMLLEASDKNNIEDNPAISDLFWKRAQPFFDDIKKQQVEPVKNIFHVFHGHTPIKAYTSIANRTFLDLGSYKTGLIGLIDIQDFLFN
ncbi:metallophosphoesterase [Paraglaciecola sp. 2405UD69-4]|uniref:metallophosphoesterase n=1 Tax=Paraglaciecola sp. 2405UD69-4 TaxID=3391836 RepID=UPI0039C962CC